MKDEAPGPTSCSPLAGARKDEVSDIRIPPVFPRKQDSADTMPGHLVKGARDGKPRRQPGSGAATWT